MAALRAAASPNPLPFGSKGSNPLLYLHDKTPSKRGGSVVENGANCDTASVRVTGTGESIINWPSNSQASRHMSGT